jgi:RNase adapter protein RapZ
MKQDRRKVLLVTGLSGAGLSTALKALEDLGYSAVDNIPLALVDPLLKRREGQRRPLALGIDSRTWDFTPAAFLKKLAALRRDKGLQTGLVFINCQDNILQQRYTETRRLHPLAVDRPVGDGVILERLLLNPLRRAADLVIDTSDLKAHELRRLMEGHYKLAGDKGLFISVMSFGFKNGVPREADLVFDVRFLDNPHWDPKLRPLSGLDAPVAAKIGRDAAYRGFFRNLKTLLAPLLPRYDHEGKSYLTVAIGCTGGRHRSVFIAEELLRWLRQRGYSAAVRHRDLEKVRPPAAKEPRARARVKKPVSVKKRKAA